MSSNLTSSSILHTAALRSQELQPVPLLWSSVTTGQSLFPKSLFSDTTKPYFCSSPCHLRYTHVWENRALNHIPTWQIFN